MAGAAVGVGGIDERSRYLYVVCAPEAFAHSLFFRDKRPAGVVVVVVGVSFSVAVCCVVLGVDVDVFFVLCQVVVVVVWCAVCGVD